MGGYLGPVGRIDWGWEVRAIREKYRPYLSILATTVTLCCTTVSPGASQSSSDGPRYRADGRDPAAFGRAQGYPTCRPFAYVTQQRCRIGAFSRYDTLLRSRAIRAPRTASRLTRTTNEPSISYRYLGQRFTLDQYLDNHPITGFLIAKGDTILVERYQYARKDTHRFASFSMTKTIVGMLIGIAVKDGAIKSINDVAEAYVPELKGTEYGRTPIKALLQMSSGVAFREHYAAGDDIRKLARSIFGRRISSVAALRKFNNRVRPPGQKFSYSSAESLVLGLVLSAATRQSVSDYARTKLWQPLGAEADASWIIDSTGQEITFAYFNATLRDLARLGLMLAHDGSWNGKSIVPRDWVLAATTVAAGDEHLKIVNYARNVGYGYQTWLLPGNRRAFALLGSYGQRVFIDPQSKLVLVQTGAYAKNAVPYGELLALWESLQRIDLGGNDHSSQSSHPRPPDGPAKLTVLATQLQRELQRVGCFNGVIDGNWGARTIEAMKTYNAQARSTFPVAQPTRAALEHIAKRLDQVCPVPRIAPDSQKSKVLPKPRKPVKRPNAKKYSHNIWPPNSLGRKQRVRRNTKYGLLHCVGGHARKGVKRRCWWK